MGILRSIGKVFGGTIFTISLGLLILMLSIVQLTKPETLQPIVSDIFEKQIAPQISSEQLNELHTGLVKICELQNKENIEYNLSGQVISLNCEEIKSSKSSDLPKIISLEFFNTLYNKSYSCEFIECTQQLKGLELLTFFLSSTANKFFNLIIFYLKIGVVIGLILIVISVRIWHSILRTIGTSCIVIGAPYFITPIILSQIKLEEAIGSVLNSVFETMNTNFLIIFVVGVALLAIGIVGKYFTGEVKKK